MALRIPEGKEAVVSEFPPPQPAPAAPETPQPTPAFAPDAPQPTPAFAPLPSSAPVLWCQNLTKTYGSAVALDRLTISVPAGRIVGLLGPNGSGKTTLLKMIAGVSHPTAGEVRVAGLPVGPQSKALVSYLPERPYFSRSMRVREMLAYFADFYSDFDGALAHEMLSRLGVDPAAACSTLSKGTVEKVQLTLVMARHAALYLLDEPIGGVDPAARDYILSTIIRAYRPQSTIILSTHLVRDVESVLDDFILLRYGQMLLHAPVAYVREKGTTLDAFFREEFRC
ncbi:ABC transporter ATP-binding protein [Adlercreutzia muris]|nr:ABC transporter ATP-binding protein [Adlercreutzia muris]